MSPNFALIPTAAHATIAATYESVRKYTTFLINTLLQQGGSIPESELQLF
jgi:hypothetical protein